jgi:type I restriction enzyme S subunit
MSKEGKIKIGEHIRIVPGFPFNSRLFNTEGDGLPLIRIRDLLKSKIETYFNGEYSYDFVISEGDILIGMDGDFHIVRWSNKKKALLNQRIMKVAQKEGALIDINYFYYFLFPLLQKVWDRTTATTVKHLSTYDISEAFEIFPSVTQQRQIATILSTADAVIEKTQAAIAKYKAIKQGMLQDLFTRGIDITTGKLRPSYQDAPELYKESKLGWIPKEWENCEMGKYISDNLYGPRFNAKDYHINGNVKTIRGTDFTKDGDILYNKAPKAQLDSSLINSHKLEDGDIVIVTTADCGLTAVFKKPINDIDFIPSAYSVKYRFMKNVNAYFIKYFMTTDVAIRQVNKYVRQGTLGNLPGSDILGFNMIYPSTDEQNKIAERLLTIDNKLQTEQDFLHKQQQIKAGLMHDLLSGKKIVKVKEKEKV